MTDRELLELAAKAVGFEFFWLDGQHPYVEKLGFWNPLTRDGDALRLLAALPSLWSLALKFGAPTIEIHVAWGTGHGINAAEFAGEDIERAAAIRRAIVRAAAAMGEPK